MLPESNTQNQYYYYYGGDEGKLTDITPTQNNIQPVNQREKEAEGHEKKYDEMSLSSKLIEESLVNGQDSLPTSPLLLYNSDDNTYCLPIKEVSINTELHVSTACVSMDIIFDNSSNALKNDINTLFVLPLNSNDSIITSTNVDINNGQRFLDTTFINNDEATKFKSKKSSDDNNNQASINTFIPNLFRLPIPLKKGDNTIKISVNYIETLQFVQSRYHFYMALNFSNFNITPTVNIKCSINCLLPGIKYGSTTHNLILTEQENLRCKLECQNKYGNNLNQNFHLFYSVETNAISAALLYDEGNKFDYDPLKSFVTFINPPVNNIYGTTFSRDIIFMLDRSGSMTGKPFNDAVKGLIFALNTLTVNDRFGIIAFDHEQIHFDPTQESQPQHQQQDILLFNASPITIEQATGWLQNISPRGMTDIKNPLIKSLNFLNQNCGNNLPFVFLFTDGCVDDEKEIVQNVINLKQENKTRICTFGIGPYCNEYFLKMLSSRSSGFNDGCIYPKDLYPKIKLMMDKAKTPILTNIKLSGITCNEIYPKTIPDLFLNAPIIISGKFENDITPNQIIKITGTLQNGEILEIAIRCDKSDIIPINKIFIKQRMDELNGEYWLYGDDKIKQQIISLSINESFPSPHTSMIAYEISPKEKNDHNAKKKNKGMNGKQIAALAGGAVVVGAGLFLLGNLAATAGNLNVLDAVSSGFAGIGDMFGGISLDCPCDACIDSIPCLQCASCGQIAQFLSCGACPDCDGCLDAIPCFNGGCNDIPCCDKIGNICESCGGILNGCTDSLGDIGGDICGSCGNIVGSCGEVCGDACGNMGNIFGDISGCFGDICEIFGDIAGSCGDIFKGITDIL